MFVWLVFDTCVWSVCFTVSFWIVYLHVCLTCFWVVFELFFKCMIVALCEVFWNLYLFVSKTCFTICFASLDFVGWCSLFCLFLMRFLHGCLNLCLVCFWCYFWGVCCCFVWPVFDTIFEWLFAALFHTFLVLFFKCLFLLCLTYFWDAF